LVVANEAVFHKKAVGKITFVCSEGPEIDKLVDALQSEQTPQTIWLKAHGKDEANNLVAEFKFKWSLKRRTHG
ncbi:MAG: thioesterase, partial [Flavobacteriaceae bacterium]